VLAADVPTARQAPRSGRPRVLEVRLLLAVAYGELSAQFRNLDEQATRLPVG
jgi:hypothetical protein